MFNLIVSALTQGKVNPSVTALFASLKKAHPTLAEGLTAYVTSGTGTTVMAISHAEWTTVHAEVVRRWSPGITALEPAVKNPSKLTPDQWVRLGQVYAGCSDPEFAALKASEATPRWFLALQGCRYWASNGLVWDPGFLYQILEAGQVPPEHFPQVILEGFLTWLGLGHTWTNPITDWKNTTDLSARGFLHFFGAHLSLVPPILANLPAKTRVMVARWLELFPHLVPPLADTLAQWIVSSAKTVREACVPLLTTLTDPVRDHVILTALEIGTPAGLGTVIDYASRLSTPGRVLLEAALAQGKAGRRDEMLTEALSRSEAVAEMPAVQLWIPSRPPLDTTELGPEFVAFLKAAIARQVESLAKTVTKDSKSRWAKSRLSDLTSLTHGDFEAMREWLNGRRTRPHSAKIIWLDALRGAQLSLLHATRCSMRELADSTGGKPTRGASLWTIHSLVGSDHDWRSVAEAAHLAGATNPTSFLGMAAFSGTGLAGRAEDIWPIFAEVPQWLDHALGVASHPELAFPAYVTNMVGSALDILQLFPALPAHYIPVIAQIATTDSKANRRKAQDMLKTQPNAWSLAGSALGSSKSEIRAEAAAWLGRIGDQRGIQPLKTALAKEKRELAEAAMLNALSLLGEDISAHLAPEVLGAAAQKGLATKPPASMEWFPVDSLPACQWVDGTSVEPQIISWWVRLAVKLKDPLGAGLIPLYISLLDQTSQEALGSFVLDAWIARDTAHPSEEEAQAYAMANVETYYQQYQGWAKRYPKSDYHRQLGAMTSDQVFSQLRQQKLSEYLGSAVADKGVLALSVGAPGRHVFGVVQRYIRDHGRRRSQVEALVTAASGNDDPAAIQLVLSVARKFKQESVRLKAAALAQEIAERCGWSLDELTDRTIPTAGFDEEGLLSLDFGPRTFIGRVRTTSRGFGIALFNPEGKPISALPKPGANDVEDLAKEARAQMSAAKKEITQIVTLQTSRLFEAMCVGRTWDATSWQEYLVAHPIMGHLVSTLVWQAWESDTYQLLRPSPGGELINADDDAITLSGTEKITLAHKATLSAEESKAWKAHLRDYEVRPLFAQFEASAPAISEAQIQIDDHLGWLSDTFAIRGRANKRGFSRGAPVEGGWFDEYEKNLAGVGIRVVIEFTGSVLPEELTAAAVLRLFFEKSGVKIPLADVPPILLAESYADYVNIAKAGVFDPDWEAKSGY